VPTRLRSPRKARGFETKRSACLLSHTHTQTEGRAPVWGSELKGATLQGDSEELVPKAKLKIRASACVLRCPPPPRFRGPILSRRRILKSGPAPRKCFGWPFGGVGGRARREMRAGAMPRSALRGHGRCRDLLRVAGRILCRGLCARWSIFLYAPRRRQPTKARAAGDVEAKC
jgi:hypothetical protein